MSSKENLSSNNVKRADIKEEINIQYSLSLLIFIFIFFCSFVIPGIILSIFFFYFFIPNILGAPNLFFLIFNINTLLTLVMTPLIIIGCYLIHLLILAVMTRILWNYTEKQSPSKDGIIPRNIPSKILDFYHIRSFMIKYPKNAFIKGPFPWLANWMFNVVKTNKIGRGTTVEEQVCGEKFVEIGENSYIGVNSVLTSHLVDGIFGNISFFKIKVGNNVTFAGLNCIASGTEINDDSYLLPFACTGKHNILKGNNYYFGIPLRKIFKKKISEYLKLTKEDLARINARTKKDSAIKSDSNQEK